jgi:VPDSG-CTERM motif
MKLSKIKNWLACLCLGGTLFVSNSAQAILLTPVAGVGVGNSAAEELAFAETTAEAFWGNIPGFGLLYKDNTIDEGTNPGIVLDPAYVPGTSLTYTVSWNLNASPFNLYAILLKGGGNTQPTVWVVGDNAQLKVGGPNTLSFSSPPVNGQSISHVTFYGARATTSVPDGGATVALLGLALGGLGVGRRFLKTA